MSDTDNNKDVDEAWAVEPPKPVLHGREALRRALILAAVGAAAVGAAVLSKDFVRDHVVDPFTAFVRACFMEKISGLMGKPVSEEAQIPEEVQMPGDIQKAAEHGLMIDGGDCIP